MTARELLAHHLSLPYATPSAEELAAWYAPDVVMEIPFAPEGHTRELRGAQAIADFFGRIQTFADDFKTTEPEIHDIEDGLVAVYQGSSVFRSTGRAYQQEYVLFLKVADGRIAHLREYYDGQRVLRALGELD